MRVHVIVCLGALCSCSSSSGTTSDGQPDVTPSDSPASSDKTTVPDTASGDGAADTKTDVGQPDSPAPDTGAGDGKWATIAKGTFSMGSPASEPCRYGPVETQHQVTLTKSFEISRTEVTQGEFQHLMGYNPAYYAQKGTCATDDCPVETVSWSEAAAYCNALSNEKGLDPCYACTGTNEAASCVEDSQYEGAQIYDCPGYRLPTEAEWEYAYRAGTSSAYYNGANDGAKCFECDSLDANADKIAWYCGNSGNAPHPVGEKTPNSWDLYDMAGNVKEWCNDWTSPSHDPGSTPTATNPWGLPSGTFRVVRGGHFAELDGHPAYLRAADRSVILEPNKRTLSVGFRCARTLP